MQRKILFLILLFGSFSLVFSSIAYYALSPPPAQQFIAWGIFSPSGTLSNYFSGSETNVTVGKILNWHMAITNQMGSVQYVQVVYRIGNASSTNPNATTPAKSIPQLGNSSIFILKSQTALLNFTWSIDSKNPRGEMIFLNMTVNGARVSPPVGAVAGQKFRFLFELWTFDVASNSFQYGYKGQNSWVGLPLEVWFNSS